MGRAQRIRKLRAAVFVGLGDPAIINGTGSAIHMRLIERDEGLSFGQGQINAAGVRIEAPISAKLKRNDQIQFIGDERVFVVNALPRVVRSGVHSASCEVQK